MGGKFPDITYRDLMRVAKRLGFCLYLQGKGSHEVWWRERDNRYTTLFNHAGKSMKRRTAKAILSDLGITVEEYIKLRGEK